jgi:hypothetical protein
MQGSLLGKTHAFSKVEVSSGGANEISSVFFWKRGRWSSRVAVVDQLVSSQGLLKGSRGECCRLHCMFHTENTQYINWYITMFKEHDLFIFNKELNLFKVLKVLYSMAYHQKKSTGH